MLFILVLHRCIFQVRALLTVRDRFRFPLRGTGPSSWDVLLKNLLSRRDSGFGDAPCSARRIVRKERPVASPTSSIEKLRCSPSKRNVLFMGLMPPPGLTKVRASSLDFVILRSMPHTSC